MKCITHNCPNHSLQGHGMFIMSPRKDDGVLVGQFICNPCWTAITKPDAGSVYSQIARNFHLIVEKRS